MPLLDQGFPVIDSTLAKVYNPSNGLAATLTSLQTRRDLLQRAVNAALEATHVAATDKERTVGVLVNDFN